MPENNNRPLLVALTIIGIIIIIILLAPRMQQRAATYSYQGYGYGLAASATPVAIRQTPDTDYYTFYRHIPVRRNTTYTTYTYTSPSYTYYPQQTGYDGGTVFSDGCTLTSPYSTTTGLPCS